MSSQKFRDALSLAEELKSSYSDYFRSEFPVKNEALRRAIFEFTASEKSPLFKGPYIQVSKIEPGSRQASTLPIDPRVISRLPFTHPYPHQAEAWEKLGGGSCKNLVLTSGTGSGKTESLLVPMISDLLKNKAKGLQAILIYPMNALLNDQYRRLTENNPENGETALLSPEWRITARKYTGSETMEDRQAIRLSPPNILLTNYKMLELMLLRGELQEIVGNSAGAKLRWLFYDELHTYTGVRGAEVALLNRRIRQAAGVSRNDLHCIAASATAGDDEAAKLQLVKFATRFFDSDFSIDSVVGFSVPKEPDKPPKLLSDIQQSMDDDAKKILENALHYSFYKPTTIEEGAKRWRPSERVNSENAEAEIRKALNILWPYPKPNKRPGIEHRAHLFISGAIRVEAPLETQAWDFINPKSTNLPSYPLAMCRECGQHGFLVRLTENGEVVPNIGRRAGLEEGAAWITTEPYDDPDEIFVTFDEDSQSHRFELPRRGRSKNANRQNPPGQRYFVVHTTMRGQADPSGFTKCPYCEARHPKGEQIRPIFSGASSNVTSIATAILEHASPEERRLIVFADSRQDVALQAGFTNQRAHRLGLCATLTDFISQKPNHRLTLGFAFSDFFDWTANRIRTDLIPASETDQRRKIAWLSLASNKVRSIYMEQWSSNELNTRPGSEHIKALGEDIEFSLKEMISTAASGATSPETLGFFAIEYIGRNERRLSQLDKAIDTGAFSYEQFFWLARWTLDRLRKRGFSVEMRIEPPTNPNERLHTLLGRRGHPTAFTRAVEKLNPEFRQLPPEEKVEIVENFLAELVKFGVLNQSGQTYTLPIHNVELQTELNILECPTCKMRQTFPKGTFDASVACFNIRCEDQLTPIDVNTRENYFYYQLGHLASELTPVHSAEHSGWIGDTRRKAIENSYNRDPKAKTPEAYAAMRCGEVNMIVASPTLEMGVDLKKTPAVVLRNMPPTAASYKQRVGRAGRDSKAGLAVAHTRQSPYDSLFFEDPTKMINGLVHSLTMPLDNELVVSRHVYAHLLETAGRSIVERLRYWRPLVFDDGSVDEAPPLNIDPNFSLFERVIVNPLKDHSLSILPGLKAMFGQHLADFDFKKCIEDLPVKLEQAISTWSRRYISLVAEYRKLSERTRDAIGKTSQEDDRNARKVEKLIFAHLGFSRDSGYQKPQNWAPLLYLAEVGILPRYEFPGDIVKLVCVNERGDDFQELVEDRFKAMREWAPSPKREKVVWALGSRHRPYYFRSEAESLQTILVCEEHNFISTEAGQQCPRCTGIRSLRLLEPSRVDARPDGSIGDDAEDRSTVGLKILQFVTGKDNQTFEDTFPDSGRVSPNSSSALLHLRSNVAITQLVGPSGQRASLGTYQWCPDCQALRVTPQNANTMSTDWHSRNCKRFDRPEANQVDANVILHAKRDEVTAIEIRLPTIVLSNRIDGDADPYKSMLEALIQAGKELCELGSRGEGLSGDIFEDYERYVVIYDPVPGGSGTMQELWKRSNEWFQSALNRMSDKSKANPKGCDCERACEKCLLDYSNQRYHGQLSRHAAVEALQTLSAGKEAFWSEDRSIDSTAVRTDDPVGWDPRSPLEKRFASLVTNHFSVRGTDLQAQRDAFPDIPFCRPDYRSPSKDRYIFVDGRDPHGKWDEFCKDARKRNVMTIRNKLWAPLTNIHIRNFNPVISGILNWAGVPNSPPQGWPAYNANSQVRECTSVPLTENGLQRLTALIEDTLKFTTDGEFSLSISDLKFCEDPFRDQAGDGNLATFKDGGNSYLIRYAIDGEWDFHRFGLQCAREILAGHRVLILPLGGAEAARFREIMTLKKPTI